MAAAARAAIVDEAGLSSEARIEQALALSGFWPALESARERAGRAAADFAIVIKPDLEGFALGSPCATTPALVEGLIDRLHDAGYSQVSVVASADSSALWAENRSVLALADLLGYRFTTSRERGYDIVDLSDDLVPAPFAPGQLLHGSKCARAWLEASFRIVFSKNKTDESQGFALCLESVLGVLPHIDKDYHYRLRRAAGEVVAEVLAQTPVHFALIDAIMSAHGSGGARRPEALKTDCVIAANDARLADYVGALKMGLDPAVSSLLKEARKRLGFPATYEIAGNLAPYPGWRNAHPLVLDSTSKRDRSVSVRRLTRPWLQTLDAELFPLKSPLDARINAKVAPFFDDVDHDRAAFGTLVATNYTLAALTRTLEAYRVLYDKDALRHTEVPLGFDPAAFTADDYDAVALELGTLEPLLAGVNEQAPGLRWRYLDEAVLFEYVRDIPVDFETFVARVDVARTIQYLNDYVGGLVVPISCDDKGRVRHQAERNLYLPQPNYLVLAEGKPIDVSKIEVADYWADRHRMCWKTIKSENGTAVYDDGIVTFSRRDADTTTVRIFGRQLFVLPPFWQALNLDLNPALKAHLVTHAYQVFFDRSCANFEALVEGREIRLGRPWHTAESPADSETLPIAGVERWGGRAAEWAQGFLNRSPGLARLIVGSADGTVDAPAGAAAVAAAIAASETGRGPVARASAMPVRVDEDGFRHFKAAPAATAAEGEPQSARSEQPGFGLKRAAEFWAGVLEAARRDAMGTPP